MSALLDAAIAAATALPTAGAGYWWGRYTLNRETSRTPSASPAASPGPQAGVSLDTLKVLTLLHSGWLLVDRSDRVVQHSAGVEALGLLRGVDLAHDEVRELVRRARRDETTLQSDVDVARGPMGDVRLDLQVRVAPLTDEYVVMLVEDLTQARRIEETRRDFVVNVSHELKTPVGGLRLLAEAVEDAADDPDAVARFSARMKTESVRLTRLVQEIVDLSRLQGADTVAAAKPVDLDECVLAAVEEVRVIADDRNIDIVVHSDSERHDVLGDSGLLTTAIRNLVSNAVNYSEMDTRIVVELSREQSDVVVRVSDEGIGMTPDELDRIFERFYRVDPARSRKTGGTGLGLAIVKHICANHGGRIQVWSEPAVGSTFEMHIPARSHMVSDRRISIEPEANNASPVATATRKEQR